MQKYRYFVQGTSMKVKQEGKNRKPDRSKIQESSPKKASFYGK